jgi:hypothetical protein
MKRQPTPDPEREFGLRVTQTELTMLVTALEYLERRNLFIATLADNQAREKEAVARRESAALASALSERLYAVGAKEAR